MQEFESSLLYILNVLVFPHPDAQICILAYLNILYKMSAVILRRFLWSLSSFDCGQ